MWAVPPTARLSANWYSVTIVVSTSPNASTMSPATMVARAT
jgi:hypothetical protein